MSSMKTDSVFFTTNQSIQELTNRLRQATRAIKGEVSQLNNDALADVPPEERLAVLISGHNFMGGQRLWGVQVFFYELRSQRAVELVAVGDKMGTAILSSYYADGYYQFGDSKKRRDRICAILTENDPTVQFDNGQDNSAKQTSAVPQPAATSEPAQDDTVHIVSSDGVDLQASGLYQASLMLKTGVEDKEGAYNMAFNLFGLLCKQFSEANPDFPACSELKYLYAIGADKNSDDYYIYEPYLQLYSDSSNVIDPMVQELVTWSKANPEDLKAWVLLAYCAAAQEDFESTNIFLYRALQQEKNGADKDSVLVNWGALTLYTGFEDWFIEKFANGQQPYFQSQPSPAPQRQSVPTPPAPAVSTSAPSINKTATGRPAANNAASFNGLSSFSKMSTLRKAALISALIALVFDILFR